MTSIGMTTQTANPSTWPDTAYRAAIAAAALRDARADHIKQAMRRDALRMFAPE